MRHAGQKKPIAFWSVETTPAGKPRLERVPMDVLEIADAIICNEPEYKGGAFD